MAWCDGEPKLLQFPHLTEELFGPSGDPKRWGRALRGAEPSPALATERSSCASDSLMESPGRAGILGLPTPRFSSLPIPRISILGMFPCHTSPDLPFLITLLLLQLPSHSSPKISDFWLLQRHSSISLC